MSILSILSGPGKAAAKEVLTPRPPANSQSTPSTPTPEPRSAIPMNVPLDINEMVSFNPALHLPGMEDMLPVPPAPPAPAIPEGYIAFGDVAVNRHDRNLRAMANQAVGEGNSREGTCVPAFRRRFAAALDLPNGGWNVLPGSVEIDSSGRVYNDSVVMMGDLITNAGWQPVGSGPSITIENPRTGESMVIPTATEEDLQNAPAGSTLVTTRRPGGLSLQPSPNNGTRDNQGKYGFSYGTDISTIEGTPGDATVAVQNYENMNFPFYRHGHTQSVILMPPTAVLPLNQPGTIVAAQTE